MHAWENKKSVDVWWSAFARCWTVESSRWITRKKTSTVSNKIKILRKSNNPNHQPLEQTTYGQRYWRKPQIICKTENKTHKREHDSFHTTTNKVRCIYVLWLKLLCTAGSWGWNAHAKHAKINSTHWLKNIPSDFIKPVQNMPVMQVKDEFLSQSSKKNPASVQNLGFQCKHNRPKVSSRRIRAKSHHQSKYTND